MKELCRIYIFWDCIVDCYAKWCGGGSPLLCYRHSYPTSTDNEKQEVQTCTGFACGLIPWQVKTLPLANIYSTCCWASRARFSCEEQRFLGTPSPQEPTHVCMKFFSTMEHVQCPVTLRYKCIYRVRVPLKRASCHLTASAPQEKEQL